MPWYHGTILQLAWFNPLRSFVALTDESQWNIYSIELTSNGRLKIRLRTFLPKHHQSEIIKESILLRTDDSQLFIFYQRTNGQKRLRVLNETFELHRTYLLDQCFASEQIRPVNQVGGLAVNQTHVSSSSDRHTL